MPQSSTNPKQTQSDPDDLKRMDYIAFKTFLNVVTRWGLKMGQARILLGDIPVATFNRLKADVVKGRGTLSGTLSKDTMERISYILGIYKALHILLPAEQADLWVQQINLAPQFNGQTALERMLKGNVTDIAVVRQYLDAERGAS